MTLKEIIEHKIIETSKFELTVYQLIVFTLIIVTTWLVLKLIKKLIDRWMKRRKLEAGNTYAFFQIVKYFIWVIAIGIGLETIGIRFNLLIASSAALLVGLGLGLQQIFNDYVAGILILFEGNIKINDVVEFGDNIGEVKQTGLRTSKIETRDDYVIVVPNHMLVNDMLVNWSHNKRNTRFHVDVGVAYGSDTRLVENILLSCAKEHSNISNHPVPFVRFNDFGNSSLDFQLYFWTENSFRVENTKSDLRFSIDNQFRKNKVTIPFPQRDVHIKKD
jgi:small-conductance mechanosensitive channel